MKMTSSPGQGFLETSQHRSGRFLQGSVFPNSGQIKVDNNLKETQVTLLNT